jgi:hypothetical protein
LTWQQTGTIGDSGNSFRLVVSANALKGPLCDDAFTIDSTSSWFGFTGDDPRIFIIYQPGTSGCGPISYLQIRYYSSPTSTTSRLAYFQTSGNFNPSGDFTGFSFEIQYSTTGTPLGYLPPAPDLPI